MTSNKFRKNAIRARMAEAQEPYSVAASYVDSLISVDLPLSKILGGFRRGALYGLSGEHKSGKTTLAIELAQTLATEDYWVYYHTSHLVKSVSTQIERVTRQVDESLEKHQHCDFLIMDSLYAVHSPEERSEALRALKQIALDKKIAVLILMPERAKYLSDLQAPTDTTGLLDASLRLFYNLETQEHTLHLVGNRFGPKDSMHIKLTEQRSIVDN